MTVRVSLVKTGATAVMELTVTNAIVLRDLTGQIVSTISTNVLGQNARTTPHAQIKLMGFIVSAREDSLDQPVSSTLMNVFLVPVKIKAAAWIWLMAITATVTMDLMDYTAKTTQMTVLRVLAQTTGHVKTG